MSAAYLSAPRQRYCATIARRNDTDGPYYTDIGETVKSQAACGAAWELLRNSGPAADESPMHQLAEVALPL